MAVARGGMNGEPDHDCAKLELGQPSSSRNGGSPKHSVDLGGEQELEPEYARLVPQVATVAQARRLERAGDLDGAVIALEGVLGRTPTNPIALTLLATIQLRRGRFDEAAAALTRAESAAGSTAATARIRGDLAYRQGKWAEAACSYREAEALGSRDTWPLVQLARCHLRMGDMDGARGAASQAAERDPDSAAAWVVLGEVCLREGRAREAESHFERAHNHDRFDQWAYAKLVEARLAQLPVERRKRELQVIMKTTGSDNRYLPGVLARLHARGGDAEAEAKAWGDQARRGDMFARKQEGFALRRAGKLEEAASVLGACLRADPEDRYVFSSYVTLQRKRGAFDELRKTLEEALPRAGSRRGAYYGALRKLPPCDASAADANTADANSSGER